MRVDSAVGFLLILAGAHVSELENARDRQDKAALQQAVAKLSKAAQQNSRDPHAQYRLALAGSYLSQVAFEIRDKALAKTAAEEGIRAAERAVSLNGKVAEHHRILGTLCGQVIPANVISGLRYGRCAIDSINKALELDPKSSDAYLSRGIGNYYLPPAFGGGFDIALRDIEKAVKLNPKSSEAHLWLGLTLRKLNRNREARAAIVKALELNPKRVWAKQQLEKAPAQ